MSFVGKYANYINKYLKIWQISFLNYFGKATQPCGKL